MQTVFWNVAKKSIDCTLRAVLRYKGGNIVEGKTLREISAETRATRRAIQGYEQAGLVAPTDKNKYGHLLYDSSAEARIRLIRFYQQLGVSVKEIPLILDADAPLKRRLSQSRIAALRQQHEQLQLLIDKATKLLATV